MRRRDFLACLAAMAAGWPRAGTAQPNHVPTIGILLHGSERIIPQVLTQTLREIGYVDGQNVRLEVRSAEGDAQRLPGLAAEFVSRNVDLIVATLTGPAVAAKEATSKIPIVMVYVGDPDLARSLLSPPGSRSNC